MLAAGLGLGLSLIIAIGAQNVFVLRQGIRREHVLAVVAICTASDAVLIAAGVGGMGAAIQAVPWLVEVARWAGAVFVAGYGVLAARRAIRGTDEGLVVDAAGDGTPAPAVGPRASVTTTAPRTRTALLPVVLTCVALTWLNPHVYLDTVVLLGSIGATYGDDRWTFALGAALGSLAWFAALGYGARLLGGVLASPRAWRVLDGVICVIMLAIAVSLVLA
ncbi:amino acid transporter [Agromyces rhizosphaerae]|uniref:Amino acid transporter n=1 Tax=Agromyces rhizosphaerae TaxID=88374 RepID=A0A9W6CWU6_9MICO|nr:amino acid transporter [Agromyces rhizosphaerae]